MTAGSDLIRRRHAVVPRGVGMFAGETTAGTAKGAHLFDVNGREILDFAGGIGVVNSGHCDDKVVRAIQEQAAKLLHTCFHIATYEPYVALCEKLVEILPHGESTKVMLVNSGAEAVENAVKIARQATGRAAIFCFEGAFHGRTLLGMSLTSKSAYKRNCGPFAPEIYRRPFPSYFHYGDGLSMKQFVERELRRFEEGFVTGPVPAEHVAAIIIECVQGEGGFIPAPPEYLQGLRRICDDHGILLICDEVQSGFCRTGKWSAYEHAGIVPDLSTWAKSLGGGMPIGAVMGKAEVMDQAEPGTIGGTYGGNPVVCAGALANIEVMEERNLNARAEHVGAKVRASFESLKDTCSFVTDVRGLGAMIAMECCIDGDPERPATDIVKGATARCREEGVLVITAGPFGNIIRVLSPLVIDDADLDRGLDVIAKALRASAEEHSS